MKQIPDLFLKGFHPDWFINCQLTFQVCDRPNNLCINRHIVQPLENFMINVVYHQNLVSVSATETKIRFRYRYRSLNFFYLNRNFLHFLFLFFCLVLNISHVIQSYHVKCFSNICLIFIGLFILVNYLQ